MSEHSKYSPSQLPRIIRCPGSVNFTANMEDQTSVYAEEGTMLHEVMETLLLRKEYDVPDTIIKKYNLTREHIDALNDCLDYIFALLAKQTSDVYEDIEAKVTLAGFADHFDCEELHEVYGTLDYAISIPSERKLVILDWKFGKGIEVFPDSAQLKAYALAKLKNPKILNNFDEVTIIVGQPRLYAGELFKEQIFQPNDLLDWAGEKLVPSLKQINADTAIYQPCDKACQWCKGKITCKARHSHNMQTAQDVFKVHAKIPDQVDLGEMTELLSKARDLNKYISDIEVFLVTRLKNAKPVPGYKLVAGRSLRKWKNEDDTRKYLLEEAHADWDDIHTSKFKSPSQIEKVLGRVNAREESFQELIFKPEGKPTMVQESDKRPALSYETAEDKFAQFVEK